MYILEVNKHTGGMWSIYGTKRRKGNKLKAWNAAVWYIIKPNRNLTKTSPMVTCPIQCSRRKPSGRKISRDEHLQNHNCPVSASLNMWFKRDSHGHKHTNTSRKYHHQISFKIRGIPMSNWLDFDMIKSTSATHSETNSTINWLSDLPMGFNNVVNGYRVLAS